MDAYFQKEANEGIYVQAWCQLSKQFVVIVDISANADIMKRMDKTSKIFKAFSDETRLRIINLLTEGEVCVCAIKEALQLPQSTVSRHLAYLKNTGWLNNRRKGVWMYYSIKTSLDALRLSILEGIEARFVSIAEGISDKEGLAEYLMHDPCKYFFGQIYSHMQLYGYGAE